MINALKILRKSIWLFFRSILDEDKHMTIVKYLFIESELNDFSDLDFQILMLSS